MRMRNTSKRNEPALRVRKWAPPGGVSPHHDAPLPPPLAALAAVAAVAAASFPVALIASGRCCCILLVVFPFLAVSRLRFFLDFEEALEKAPPQRNRRAAALAESGNRRPAAAVVGKIMLFV